MTEEKIKEAADIVAAELAPLYVTSNELHAFDLTFKITGAGLELYVSDEMKTVFDQIIKEHGQFYFVTTWFSKDAKVIINKDEKSAS